MEGFYNIALREDDRLIDELARQGNGLRPVLSAGFTPLQSSALDATAASLKMPGMQVALAWLLHRTRNILLIPGTSSVKHLRENLDAATLQLPPENDRRARFDCRQP